MKFESKRSRNEEFFFLMCFTIPKNVFSLQLFLGWSLGFAFSKMICKAFRRLSYTNDSKWRRIEKDLPKCSVIGR
jgi:hypothetical protein